MFNNLLHSTPLYTQLGGSQFPHVHDFLFQAIFFFEKSYDLRRNPFEVVEKRWLLRCINVDGT